ncbi:MAG: GntR family transcriptional regulator [Cognatishimia sp.]|nr:GntR family transcriptional regulator [Cognatishimia sp.]
MTINLKSKTATADEIALQLTEAIHTHRLNPGAKLREDEICDIFQVSRTIVRQSLHSLQHKGLVTILRNKGAFVAKPTLKEAREVFEARSLIEPAMARAAALRATPEDVAFLEDHMKAEKDALDREEVGEALRLSGDFHVQIARIADHNLIEALLAQLVARSALIIALYWRRRNALSDSSSHLGLVNALRDRDADGAEEIMKGHLLDLLMQLDLRDSPTGPFSLKDALKK